jgi:hypothetical protein
VSLSASFLESGLTIETKVKPDSRKDTVDLFGTNLEDVRFQTYRDDKGDEDWILCEVSGGKFVGTGDSGKLQTILEIFVSLIGK